MPPGVLVRLEPAPKIATIGDPIRLDLEITMPEGWKADILAPEKQAGDFSILEFHVVTSVPLHQRMQITAAVYKTGEFTFPPVTIRLRSADGQEMTVSSPAAKIEIRSVLPGKDRNLKDLKKQLDLPEAVQWALWITILLAVGAVAAVAWYLWRRRRTHPQLSPAPSPPDLLAAAEADLKALLARGLPDDRSVKEFYVRLSEIVKRILEAGYTINTAEQTTSEIMEALNRRAGAAPENMDRIQSFLLRCDIVKFAKYVPVSSEHESAAADALWILEKSRQSPAASRQGSAGVSPAAASEN